MVQPFVLGVAVLLLAFGGGLLWRGVGLARLVGTLRSIAPTPITADVGEIQQVKGRLEGDPLLQSPLQKRDCLYYFFRVLEPRPGKPARTLATGKQWTLVQVRDETGVAEVDARPALVASPRRYEKEFAGLTEIPFDQAAFFESAGIDAKHLPRLPRFTVHEYTLEPGDEVYVTGSVRERDGRKEFYRRRRRPLIVSAERDIGYVQGLRNELVLYAALPPLCIVAGLALAYLSTL